MERVGSIVGTAASPWIYEAIGYFGVYGLRVACLLIGWLYLVFYIREPDNSKFGKVLHLVKYTKMTVN